MIYVLARSQKHGQKFISDHPFLLPHLKIEYGQRSYYDVINKIISSSNDRYACIVHDDVLFCSDFVDKLNKLINELDEKWTNWGLVGNAGVLSFRIGYGANQVVRYISDPHGGPNLTSHILPAQSVDGNVMLLNCHAMRERRLSVPGFEGFQLYDIILSIETLKCGLGVFIAPQLAVWHASGGNQMFFDRAKSCTAFNEYLCKQIKNRTLKTLNGQIKIKLLPGYNPADRRLLDVDLDSLRCSIKLRPTKSVAIVVRSQFGREQLLYRALFSIHSFINSAEEGTAFKCYIVSDKSNPASQGISQLATVLETEFPGLVDTRYKLVQFAANNIEADYFWFVDDDDWLFPNEAERLGLIVNVTPFNAVIFLDCQHFNEGPTPPGNENDAYLFRSAAGPYFSALNFLKSLYGMNSSPFCGVIFPRSALLNIPNEIYDSITYFEDYMTILSTILSTGYTPIVVDRLYAGISVRTEGNTITKKDRSIWNRSMSELTSHIANSPIPLCLISLPFVNNDYSGTYFRKTLKAIKNSKTWKISGLYRTIKGGSPLAEARNEQEAITQVISILQSFSWDMMAPIRIIGRIMRKIHHLGAANSNNE